MSTSEMKEKNILRAFCQNSDNLLSHHGLLKLCLEKRFGEKLNDLIKKRKKKKGESEAFVTWIMPILCQSSGTWQVCGSSFLFLVSNEYISFFRQSVQ